MAGPGATPGPLSFLPPAPVLAAAGAGRYSDRMPAVRLILILLGGLGMAVAGTGAGAEEYRLQVANLYRDSFSHFFDGPIGTGTGELAMPRLERALDTGEIAPGALLTDRVLRYGWDDLVRSFGAVKVRGFITPGEGHRRWDEAVWEGKPGERSVWVIGPSVMHYQGVYHTALRGKAEAATLRYYVPYRVTGRPSPAAVVAYPLALLRFYTDRGNLWDRYLSRSVSLAEGIALVVGVNDNPGFADWVYIMVEHPPQPTTFKIAVGWDRRRADDRSNLQGWER